MPRLRVVALSGRLPDWAEAACAEYAKRLPKGYEVERLAAKRLELNEVGYCNLALDEPVAFAAYARNRALGGFILIDRQSNATVAAGTLDFALRRAALGVLEDAGLAPDVVGDLVEAPQAVALAALVGEQRVYRHAATA